ncbi:MAG TPA: tandem-95 repeat protein [Ohtaekwangia sp.]|uniref:tandem-95 repeat protein n=1 Tax=Ohtaekwangia sp. TaxID=2066019 RepID=UPI002F937FE2
MRYIFICFILFIVVLPALAKKPKIQGQQPVSISEDQSYTIQLTDLDVKDIFYPWGYTLTVYSGNNYTLSGNTVIPASNFAGILTVPVTVNNGSDDSNKFDFKITVNPVNDAPVITGQTALQTTENTPVTIALANLTVSDPDNSYPTGFSLSLAAGSNYTVNGATVTPSAGFTGTLTVGTTVSDGAASSNQYGLKINVVPGNVKPVITGQVALSTPKNKAITLQLANLTVTDPDDAYPGKFTMSVAGGSNYTASGTTVTPAQNFVGTLSVPVTVNDGKASSAPYNVKITVTNELQITGQQPLETNEDQPITLKLADLVVSDPSNVYPSGFTLQILAGENYTANGLQVTPSANFYGTLSVGVTVSNGTATTNPYSVKITVNPVNDAPEIAGLETDPLLYTVAHDAVAISKTLTVSDVDDNSLVLAEISFQPETFESGADELIFQNTATIRGVYDSAKGVMSLIGFATLAEYRDALRSVKYLYDNVNDPMLESKKIYIRLNDGKAYSIAYEREIDLQEEISFDIPNGFTPNNDAANDTWKVRPLKHPERFDKTTIRVYNKRGSLVFQTTGFEKDWDGRWNGEVLPPDTYYYTIDLNLTYLTNSYKGIVTIMR